MLKDAVAQSKGLAAVLGKQSCLEKHIDRAQLYFWD